jgi:DNA-binding Lrp family transcriptional regulator
MSSQVVAYVLLIAEVGKEYEVVQELKKIKGMKEVKAVYGEFDIVSRIEGVDLKALDEAVTQLRKIPSVIRTVTLISS